MPQQATSGNARYSRVPNTWVNWTGHEASPTAHQGYVFSEISKSVGAAIDYEQRDNDGELSGLNTKGYFIDLSFSIIPVGTAVADALNVAEALPFINDELAIYGDATTGAHPDADLAGKCYCKGATARFTPDGDCVIDIQARKYVTVAAGVPTNVDLS